MKAFATLPGSSDEQLVRKAQAGDRNAFEKLVHRYDRQVLTLALRFSGNEEDAKDIYQEVFIRVYRALPGFEFRSAFRTWLFRVASNACLTHRVKASRMKTVPIDQKPAQTVPITGPPGAGELTEQRVIRRELSEVILSAMGELSPKQRLVFEMRHYHGYKLAEIATLLNCAEGTVKRHLFTATRRMRKRLSVTTEWSQSYAT